MKLPRIFALTTAGLIVTQIPLLTTVKVSFAKEVDRLVTHDRTEQLRQKGQPAQAETPANKFVEKQEAKEQDNTARVQAPTDTINRNSDEAINTDRLAKRDENLSKDKLAGIQLQTDASKTGGIIDAVGQIVTGIINRPKSEKRVVTVEQPQQALQQPGQVTSRLQPEARQPARTVPQFQQRAPQPAQVLPQATMPPIGDGTQINYVFHTTNANQPISRPLLAQINAILSSKGLSPTSCMATPIATLLTSQYTICVAPTPTFAAGRYELTAPGL